MKNEHDMRIRKTRASIRNAVITLMKEKPLAEISVTEICDLAMCSRNTFYMHYPYKEAVLERMVGEVVEKIVAATRDVAPTLDLVDKEKLETYAEEIIMTASKSRGEIVFLMTYSGCNDFLICLTKTIYESFMENTRVLVPAMADDKEFQFYCWYLAGGISGAVSFIKNNPEIPDEDLVHMFRQIHSTATQVSMDHVRKQITESRGNSK